jgi:hypothetical protein
VYSRARIIVITLWPSALKPMHIYERQRAEESMYKSGLTPEEWANSVDRSKPIQACLYAGNNLRIGDGHHRHLAAEILNKPLSVHVYTEDTTPNEISQLCAMQVLE